MELYNDCFTCRETKDELSFIGIHIALWTTSKYHIRICKCCWEKYTGNDSRRSFDLSDWIEFAGKEWEPIYTRSGDILAIQYCSPGQLWSAKVDLLT